MASPALPHLPGGAPRACVILFLAILAGCATPVVMLKNDATGELARCGGTRIGEGQGLTPEEASTEFCVRQYEAQGYRRTSEATEALRRAAASRPAPPPRTPTLGPSRWLITAEGLAKANGCTTPLVTMVDKGPGSERFTAACANGSTLALACDFDGCRLPR